MESGLNVWIQYSGAWVKCIGYSIVERGLNV